MRTIITLFAALALSIIGAGVATAGGGGGGAVCRGFDVGASLSMRDHCFEGTGHVLAAGQTITVTNAGNSPHTITAADGSFDSGIVAPGDTYELTIDAAGAVPIYCTLHGSDEGNGMAGLLAVQGVDISDAQPAAAGMLSSSPWPWVLSILVAGLAGAAMARMASNRSRANGPTGPRRNDRRVT